jgi:uncharacterized protein YkwD
MPAARMAVPLSVSRLGLAVLRLALTAALCLIRPAFPAACTHVPTPLEQSVFEETNLVRSDPHSYAKRLEALRKDYQGRKRQLPGGVALITQEGLKAVDEAIAVLRSARPLPKLKWHACLSQSALDHVRDIGPKGLLAHQGSRGESFSSRIERYGSRYEMISENMSFGSPTGRDVVMDLLVDDGVRDRGHRRNLLDPEAALTGVACGPHATYRTVCVIEYARGERRKS